LPAFTDQLGRTIDLEIQPSRIISLVPSQTELLYALGLDDEVIGITKFCSHPTEWFRSKTRVGGTKKLNIEKIQSLNPDLIIANKEENLQSEIELLSKYIPVWISDICNLTNAVQMITQVGALVHKQEKAMEIIKNIQLEFEHFRNQGVRTAVRTCYLIWKDPYMTAGGDTFINDMLEHAGLENVYKSKNRYPEITVTELKNMNIQLLLLSSEPYPFKEKHVAELQHALRDTKIMLCDGEMFSWYGSRLSYAPQYFKKLRDEIAIS